MRKEAGKMERTKIKICGLTRPCDIRFVNEARPDFAGFVINFLKSRRTVSPQQAKELREQLDGGIVPVGVFVNEDVDTVAELLNCGVISMAQLHGQEDEAYIARLRERADAELIQAITVRSASDLARAAASSADYILLDNGTGTGKTFDWSLIGKIARPWFLAGGLTPGNLARACARKPFAVDLSSGVETDGYKDREKILAAVEIVRNAKPAQDAR